MYPNWCGHSPKITIGLGMDALNSGPSKICKTISFFCWGPFQIGGIMPALCGQDCGWHRENDFPWRVGWVFLFDENFPPKLSKLSNCIFGIFLIILRVACGWHREYEFPWRVLLDEHFFPELSKWSKKNPTNLSMLSIKDKYQTMWEWVPLKSPFWWKFSSIHLLKSYQNHQTHSK